MRVAKKIRGYKVASDLKPNGTPLNDGSYRPKAIPTVFFSVDFDIDDSEFEVDQQSIGSIVIKKGKSGVVATSDDAYEEPDEPEFDEDCTPECKPGHHVCGKE